MEGVRAILGQPYYESEHALLYNVDCASAMGQLVAAKQAPFQLTVTSPPYNIGKEYEQKMPMDEYVRWCAEWCRQVHALTTATGAFWLNVGYVPLSGRGKAVPLPYLLWDKTPFFLMQEVVWNYGAGVACRNSFSPRNEKFLWYVKTEKRYTFNLDDVRDPDVKYPNQKKEGKLRCNPNGKNPSDVWTIPKVTSGEKRASSERTSHPAQFPSAVIERVVLASSDPGDLILDPFMGSGTTATVAIEHGRNVVGFEIREDYCAIAAERMRSAASADAGARKKQRASD